MTDIIIRTSDGRVQDFGNAISLDGDTYLVTKGEVQSHEPLNSFGFETALVHGVTGVPSDFVGGYNYNYVDGAFAASGTSPPAPPPAPSIWAKKMNLSPSSFIAVAAGSIGPVAFNRIETDSHSSSVYAEVITSDSIDPMSADFQQALAYLEATNGDDGQKLLTGAQTTAINTAWPNKS